MYKELVPKVRVHLRDNTLFEIHSMQDYYETQDKIEIKCAEYIPLFQRGFVCDLEVENSVKVEDGESLKACYFVKEVVLVYTIRNHGIDHYPDVRYVFFK